MPSFVDIVKRLMAANPSIANNPNNKEMLDAVLSGDAKRGEEFANNILASKGMSREDFFKQFGR